MNRPLNTRTARVEAAVVAREAQDRLEFSRRTLTRYAEEEIQALLTWFHDAGVTDAGAEDLPEALRSVWLRHAAAEEAGEPLPPRAVRARLPAHTVLIREYPEGI